MLMIDLLVLGLRKYWIYVAPVLADLAWGIHQRRAGSAAEGAKRS
jgi:hypothetical protein